MWRRSLALIPEGTDRACGRTRRRAPCCWCRRWCRCSSSPTRRPSIEPRAARHLERGQRRGLDKPWCAVFAASPAFHVAGGAGHPPPRPRCWDAKDVAAPGAARRRRTFPAACWPAGGGRAVAARPRRSNTALLVGDLRYRPIVARTSRSTHQPVHTPPPQPRRACGATCSSPARHSIRSGSSCRVWCGAVADRFDAGGARCRCAPRARAGHLPSRCW